MAGKGESFGFPASDLIKAVYEEAVKKQLEDTLRAADLLDIPKPPEGYVSPYRSVTARGIETVGDLKKFLAENNVPDDATFYDTGYETDGTYDFQWREETDGSTER